MATKLIIMALSILLSQCGHKQRLPHNINERFIDFSFLDTASYFVIPLETLDESRIGNVSQILFEDERIFVADFSETFSVTIFSSSGEFLARIQSVGDGVGEYGTNRLAFDLDRDRKEVLVYDVVARKLVRYSFNGEFIRENSLVDFRGTDFAYLGNDKYAFWMGSEDKYQILVTDSVGIVLKKHNPIPDKYSYLLSLIPGFFSKGMGNEAWYIPIWEDKIFRITAESTELKIDFGFSDNIVSTLDEIELLGNNQTQDRFSCFFALLVNEKGQFATSIRHLGEYHGETLGIPVHIFGNLTTGNIEGGKLGTSVADFKEYGLGIGYPVGQKGEFFVRAINPDIVISVYPDEFGFLQSTDNPCLFFYKINL